MWLTTHNTGGTAIGISTCGLTLMADR